MIKKVKYFIKDYYRHAICIAIILYSLYLAFFYFEYAGFRIKESLYDCYTTAVNYICKLIGVGYHGATVIEFSSAPFDMPFNLPGSWEDFKVAFQDYWLIFFDLETMKNYGLLLADILFYISQIIMILAIPAVFLYIRKIFKKPKINNNFGKKKKTLVIFLWIEIKILDPIKFWIIDFIDFVKDNDVYFRIFIIIWLWNFNIFTIILEFFAFLFYFVATFDCIHLYVQVLKLLMDLSVVFDFIPGVIWIIIILAVINHFRHEIGYNSLNHKERKNRGFINERPFVILDCGTMGVGKTKLLTDMALSLQAMDRRNALNIIIECVLEFPSFDYQLLINELKEKIFKHEIYNLYTCEKFLMQKKEKFYLDPKKENIWEYDFLHYGLKYNNGLHLQDIWDTLNDFIKCFFIYVCQTTILSNYSIRDDSILYDNGNFPVWDDDFFRRDSKTVDYISRFSHIFDNEMFRLGKKLVNSPYKDSFEFGIVVESEIGKERKNALELNYVKATEALANQKNDLFNRTIELIRHPSTVRGVCFAHFLCDEQRPEAWGANARDLCEIIWIEEKSDTKLTMPLFVFGELIHSIFFNGFANRWVNDKFNHGDTSLKRNLDNRSTGLIHQYYRKIYNTFGYQKLNVLVESGRMDEGKLKASKKKYYLMNKKIMYRYSTDCYKSFFRKKASQSLYGINDIPCFEAMTATFDEMKSTNSYSFNEMVVMFNLDKE